MPTCMHSIRVRTHTHTQKHTHACTAIHMHMQHSAPPPLREQQLLGGSEVVSPTPPSHFHSKHSGYRMAEPGSKAQGTHWDRSYVDFLFGQTSGCGRQTSHTHPHTHTDTHTRTHTLPLCTITHIHTHTFLLCHLTATQIPGEVKESSTP